MPKAVCSFCDLDLSGRTIMKDEIIQVFLTNTPIVPGHVLVTPVRHVSKINELTAAEWQAVKITIEKIKTALCTTLSATGFNVAWNEGTEAGQTVPHLHVHVVPRKLGDAGIYEYEPRQFLYRPGSRAESAPAELAEVAGLLRRNI